MGPGPGNRAGGGETLARSLARSGEDGHTALHAAALNNLSVVWLGLGRWSEAADTALQSVSVYRRQQAQAGRWPWRRRKPMPADKLSDLATVMTNLAALERLGRRREAVGLLEEAIVIRRQLVRADPAAHLPGLAMTLNNLAVLLTEPERAREAMALIDEVIDIYRVLAPSNPDAYLHELAGALVNRAVQSHESHQDKHALVSIEESVQIFRALSATHPSKYQPGLATALIALGALLPEHREEEAQALRFEVIQLYQQLADATPGAYLDGLALAQNNLGSALAKRGQHDESLRMARLSVETYRRFAEANPGAAPVHMALALNNLADQLEKAGLPDESLAVAEEGIAILRRLVAVDPEGYRAELAGKLSNYAILTIRAGAKLEAGLEACEEAAQIYIQLLNHFGEIYFRDFSLTYLRYVRVLRATGRHREADEMEKTIQQIYNAPGLKI